MTGSSSLATAGDTAVDVAVRQVELRLRDALAHLGPNVSRTDVQVAQQTMGDAERTLRQLVDDPWERSVVLRAQEILSSHLLAAEVCDGADTAPAVTAGVLRRGATTAQRLLTGHDYSPGGVEQAR